VLFTKAKFAVIPALLVSASMWFYFDHILVPRQIADAAATGRPRGNLSDLYPRWLGARELLLRNRNPYSFEVTREIQAGYYGRVLDASRPADPQDQQAFAYPVYVVFILSPTVRLPFNIARQGFNDLLWILTGLTVLLWLRVLRWKPSKLTTIILITLTLGSLPAVQGIKLQQLSLLVAAMLSASLAALASGHLIVSGILLALATIKPQLVWPLLLWLIAWALANWRKRQPLAWSFAITMLLLLLGSQMILPGWVSDFRAAVTAYHQYTQNTSVLGWLFSPRLGDVLAVILVLSAAVLCRPFLRESYDSPNFGIIIAFLLALTVTIVPNLALYNQVLLLPALLLLIGKSREFWNEPPVARMLYALTVAVVLWPWMATCVLVFSNLLLPARVILAAWKLPLLTTLTVPLLGLALMGLYVFKRLPPEFSLASPRKRSTAA
jgi:hypothetical protein